MSVPRLRAPVEHGSVLAEPPLDRVGPLLESNHALLSASAVRLLEQPLSALRRQARAHAFMAATRYLEEAGQPVPASVPQDRWLLAGHQPELFHPGVWFKNFALTQLARRHDAFSLNLVVDNDTAKAATLHVPAGKYIAKIPFDVWQGEVPYEERRVLDEQLFAELPKRVQPLTADWTFTPMLPAFWHEVRRQAERTPLLGERFAAARRAWERRWGCIQHEVPLSRLCQGPAFAVFACHLLDDLARLHDVYNGAVHAYRVQYGLRSTNHPVPDLQRDGDWLETPFWAWRQGQTRRSRLFARRTSAGIELRAGADTRPTLRHAHLVEDWGSLEPAGFKVRTRALTTTLFARLLLADVFVHGIGGGKYDELTDVLFRQFFDLPAPTFVVLSATLLLPLPRFGATDGSCARLAREARDLHYNPQRHLDAASASAEALAQEKQAWIGRTPEVPAQRRERFQQLRRLNDALHPFVAERASAVHTAAETCREELALNAVRNRRDWSFCLYPEAMLRDFYGQHLERF